MKCLITGNGLINNCLYFFEEKRYTIAVNEMAV